MRATVIHDREDVRFEERPDPELRRPTDAVVRVGAACVCGSDLWPYRGEPPEPHPTGREFVGVEQTGTAVPTVRPGDFVVAPFAINDNTCVHCRRGVHPSRERGECLDLPMEKVAEAYAAMDERRAIKTLLRP